MRINGDNPFAIYIAPDDYILTTINDHNSFSVFSPTHEHIAKFDVHGKGKGIVLLVALASSTILLQKELINVFKLLKVRNITWLCYLYVLMNMGRLSIAS